MMDYESIAQELESMANRADGATPSDRYDAHHLLGESQGLRRAARVVREASRHTESKSVGRATQLEPHEAQMLLDLALQTLNGIEPAPQDAAILDKLEDIAKGTEHQSKDGGVWLTTKECRYIHQPDTVIGKRAWDKIEGVSDAVIRN